MPAIDFPSIALGVLLAAIPLLVVCGLLYRRFSLVSSELALVQERLMQARGQEESLHAQVDGLQDDLAVSEQARQRLQVDLASASRECELLRQGVTAEQARVRAFQDAQDRSERELRTLGAERAALAAELQELRDSHQQRLEDLQGARDVLRAQFAELAGRIFDEREQRFSETSQQRLGQLLDPLKERIQSFEKRVEESYQQEARERFSLAKELERLQLLNQRLGDEANNLTQALKGQKVQGNWGELVLESVLEHAGLEKGREYQTQVSLKNTDGSRFQPDVLLQLPGDKQIVVDAKVSLTAYQQYISAKDEKVREQALKQHLQSLRSHLKGLSGKDYSRLEGLNSLDFVLLFVPIEAAFSSALQADQTLVQDAFAQQVVIVSPTTLLATLRVIDSLWRQERQNQNAREIAERAGRLYDKFVAFVDDLEEIGSRLQQADKAYEAARNKLVSGRGNLVGRAENLRRLGARSSKSLSPALLEGALQNEAEDGSDE